MTKYHIPVYQPDLSGNEKRYVSECLDSTWISSRGRFIGDFERGFAGYIGSPHAIAVTNGTVALHVALAALGIGKGDEVIVPTLTYIAAANAAVYTGATPVFVDSLPEVWQVDPADVRRKITPRTRAIMAVHLYGHPCDMDALTAIARERNLFLIEDCAEAFGARQNGRHVGTFGDIAAFSFFGNKTITTGEGGMVVTGDAKLDGLARRLKNQGLAADREYWHDLIGFNYRMTNISAAIGLAQLERADDLIARKRRLAEAYRSKLAGMPVEVHGELPGSTHAYWMVSILTKDASDRDPLRARLANRGIETRPLFNPVHLMPMYAGSAGQHPVAEAIARRGMNLPSWPGLSPAQVDEVCGTVRDYYQQK